MIPITDPHTARKARVIPIEENDRSLGSRGHECLSGR
jgi:hypothetical protein